MMIFYFTHFYSKEGKTKDFLLPHCTISSSFFDTGTTGRSSGVGSGTLTGVTGLTTDAAFTSGSSYSNWDFSNTGTASLAENMLSQRTITVTRIAYGR